MPHKYSKDKAGQNQHENRLNRIRRNIYRLLLAILYPGHDIAFEITRAEVYEVVNYLLHICGQTGQADHKITG